MTEPLALPSSTPVPNVPYRGIEEFRYVDSPIFFGRDFEAQHLLRLITIYRGVLLYGDSGVGKSSLVNAKAIPLSVDDGYAPERVRVQAVKGAEFVVERIAPSDEPGLYLPSLFDDGAGERRIGLAADAFFERLDQCCCTAGTAVYPLIIFDQFEELATLTDEALHRGDPSAQEAYDAIVATLLRILRDETLRVKLLFVFREDYYAKLTNFFSQTPTLIDNYLRLEPMHSRQLDDIINGPFRKVAFDHRLPSDVAELLENELRARRRSDLLTLSEVQIACLSLWHSPEPLKLLQTHHVDGLLEMYFSKALFALPFELLDPATALLDKLVTESETRNVISAETLIEALQKDQRVPRAVTCRALEALDKTAHVIRRERRNDVEVYEIVSEFLVPWIMRRRVEMQADNAAKQRELQKARDVRRGMAAFAFVAVLVVGAWIYSEVTRTKGVLENKVAGLRDEIRADKLALQENSEALANAQTEANAARSALASARTKANAAQEEAAKAIAQAARIAAECNGARIEKLPKNQPWQDWLSSCCGLEVANRPPNTVMEYKLPKGIIVTGVAKGSRASPFIVPDALIVALTVTDKSDPTRPVNPHLVANLDDVRSALAKLEPGGYLHWLWIAPGSTQSRGFSLKMADVPPKS
jgi:hypothetical protein